MPDTNLRITYRSATGERMESLRRLTTEQVYQEFKQFLVENQRDEDVTAVVEAVPINCGTYRDFRVSEIGDGASVVWNALDGASVWVDLTE